MMLQSTGQWYFKEDGSLNILDNAALKATLEQYARIWQSGIVKPVSGWADFTGGFTSGEVAAVPIGVWITGTIKANPDQSGKWAVAPIPTLPGIPSAVARLQLGWLELVRPGEIAEQGRRHRLPEVGLGRRRRLLPEDPRRSGRRRHAARGARWQRLPAQGSVLRRRAGVAGLRRLARRRSRPSEYGTYTAEVDAAVQAQLPTIAQGGSIDDAIKAINEQAQAQIQ